MASIEYRARSTRVIAYVNKEKQSFALGRVTKKTAARFAGCFHPQKRAEDGNIQSNGD